MAKCWFFFTWHSYCSVCLYFILFSLPNTPLYGYTYVNTKTSSMFTILRNWNITFQSIQQCIRCLHFPLSHQHILCVCVYTHIWIYTLAIFVGIKYHNMVFICILVMTDDIKHIFMYLLVICTSYLGKYLLKSFAHFLIESFVFLLFSRRSLLYIFWILDTFKTHFYYKYVINDNTRLITLALESVSNSRSVRLPTVFSLFFKLFWLFWVPCISI